MFSTHIWLMIACTLVANAVLFGFGIVPVLAIPALAEHANYLIPAVVVAALVLAPIAASFIVPRMRLRNHTRQEWKRGDLIS
ncbi:hypothetical protein [Chelativorans sp. ZYF759]|uniref:hypothetical protein n=1 Tax=Chelativorans sp. ZYF759 TaxID=2692213 RepID=UPI001FEF5DA3|nr:hypothetical protein [Chelativorans sp. ZYF759]